MLPELILTHASVANAAGHSDGENGGGGAGGGGAGGIGGRDGGGNKLLKMKNSMWLL